jgi:hypothetical protein
MADLTVLGRIGNATTRTTLELCSENPGSYVSLTDIVDAAGLVGQSPGRDWLD